MAYAAVLRWPKIIYTISPKIQSNFIFILTHINQDLWPHTIKVLTYFLNINLTTHSRQGHLNEYLKKKYSISIKYNFSDKLANKITTSNIYGG